MRDPEKLRAKRAKWNKKMCPDRTLVCLMCGEEHIAYGGSGRKSPVCAVCYPLYRKATGLYAAARYRSRKRDLEFSLSVPWIFYNLNQPCPKTGEVYVMTEVGRNYNDRHPLSPTIDRKNPNLGYTEENCRVVCWWYNCAKQQHSDATMLEMSRKVVSYADRIG